MQTSQKLGYVNCKMILKINVLKQILHWIVFSYEELEIIWPEMLPKRILYKYKIYIKHLCSFSSGGAFYWTL